MYSTILHNNRSCVYQWALHSTLAQKTVKAQEYTERLDNLDIALNDKQRTQVFDLLMLQIQWHSDSGATNRNAVMALTAAQCKSILQELHKGLGHVGLSRELNNAKFEAVNVYSSERAKGKVYALYEYLMLKKGADDALPADVSELEELPRGSGRALERQLKSIDLPVHLPTVPLLNLTPALGSTGSSRQSVNLTVEDAVDYVYPHEIDRESIEFLDAGVSAGYWTRTDAGHFSQQAGVNDAIKQLKYLCELGTIQNRENLSSKLARTVKELIFENTYSSRLRDMAKEYLRKKIIQSEQIVPDYRETIRSLMDANDSNISALGRQHSLHRGSLAHPLEQIGQSRFDPYAVADQPATEVMLEPSAGTGTSRTETSVLGIAKQFTKKLLQPGSTSAAETGSSRHPQSLFEGEGTGPTISTEQIKTVVNETAESLAATAATAKTKLTAAAGKASVKLEAAATATKSIFSEMVSSVRKINWSSPARSQSAPSSKDKGVLGS